MTTLAVILARAGSKGLTEKCMQRLMGRPLIEYTLDHALASRLLTAIVMSTDSLSARRLASLRHIETIDRPAELATDKATVDSAARHAVETWEARHQRTVDAVVLLYGNIPVRAEGVIDRAITNLAESGASSIRTVAPVGKLHPDWLHRVIEDGRMVQFRVNSIYRRQDLEPLFYHDGAVVVVTRAALFGALRTPDDHQSFLGPDRRAMIQDPLDAVDVDEAVDLHFAEAVLRAKTASNSGSDGPSQRSELQCCVRVAERIIGPGCPTFVIAEAGVNHNGSLEKALQLVDTAAECGADAVKFQVFRAEEIASPRAATAAYQQSTGAQTQRELLRSLELTDVEFAVIRGHCQQRGVHFLATPFSPHDVDRLSKLEAPALKIASTDINNIPLMHRAARTGLPMIVSTGASTREEIAAAIRRLTSWGADQRLILLHCVSCYPTPLDAANLGAIAGLRREFGLPCGFSDHTLESETGAWAVANGACVLEKHFTLDRNASGPDHAMSLDPAALREYIRAVRGMERARGTGQIGMHPAEHEVRQVARRSIVADRDIPAGTRLSEEMLSVKRPAGGIEPDQFESLIGRTLTVGVPRDGLITWDMLK